MDSGGPRTIFLPSWSPLWDFDRPRIKLSVQNLREVRWQGPFKVYWEIGRINYEIEMPEARKKYRVLQINLLRQFKRRQPEISMTAIDSNLNVLNVYNNGESEVCSGLCESVTHLGEKTKEELLNLLQDFRETFSGTPGRTKIVKYQINKGEPWPLRQRP